MAIDLERAGVPQHGLEYVFGIAIANLSGEMLAAIASTPEMLDISLAQAMRAREHIVSVHDEMAAHGVSPFELLRSFQERIRPATDN